MDISDENLLNENSLLVPTTQTQSLNIFSSELMRRFSLKSSQQKPVLAETVINDKVVGPAYSVISRTSYLPT